MYRRKSFFHVWAATVILVVTGVPYTPAGAVLFLQDPTISSFLVPHGFKCQGCKVFLSTVLWRGDAR
jgi:hypothetical protein